MHFEAFRIPQGVVNGKFAKAAYLKTENLFQKQELYKSFWGGLAPRTKALDAPTRQESAPFLQGRLGHQRRCHIAGGIKTVAAGVPLW